MHSSDKASSVDEKLDEAARIIASLQADVARLKADLTPPNKLYYTTRDRLRVAEVLQRLQVPNVMYLADNIVDALEKEARKKAEVAEGWERSDELAARADR